jgi:nitrate/TMAO reductase-like tetraheme cytochrome c subunit
MNVVRLARVAGGPRGLSVVVAGLFAIALATSTPAGSDPNEVAAELAKDPHYAVFKDERFPEAERCASCHEEIYNEWRASAHANAAISPMFHRFEQKLNDFAYGTVNTFCVRCHIPVGTTLGEDREMPIWERNPTSIEGVTCVVCHRVDEYYGRVNGERRMIEGSIFEPIYGPVGVDMSPVINNSYVATEPGADGTPIHKAARHSDYISSSEFCASCHQVAVHPGIKLEVVYEQYRDSPSHRKGVTCQQCHMSKEPGLPSGFLTRPRAVVNTEPIKPGSKGTDHSFVGPGTSIVHPGIFPHNIRSNVFSIRDWMTFNWESDWGRDGFEDKVAAGSAKAEFPAAWQDAKDRRDARSIVEENLVVLNHHLDRRLEIMERGSHMDGPYFKGALRRGTPLRFHYEITNTCEGHNLPSGSLGAQPEIWLNVALINPDGETVWESGYIDSHGDMADVHSRDVREGKLPHDDQLFNLQSKFLTTNVKGTDREMYLPVNFDVDQRPFIRPGATPNSVMNHPPFVRMEQRSIPPLGMKKAKYTVPASVMTKPGMYKLAARMRSRAEPIYFMDFVEATPEMKARMNERMIDIHPYTVEFEVH